MNRAHKIQFHHATEPPNNTRCVIGLYTDGGAEGMYFDPDKGWVTGDVYARPIDNLDGLIYWFDIPSLEGSTSRKDSATLPESRSGESGEM